MCAHQVILRWGWLARSPVITGDGCWLPLKPLSPPGSVVRRARRLHAESRLLMTTCSSQCQLVLFLVRDLPCHAPCKTSKLFILPLLQTSNAPAVQQNTRCANRSTTRAALRRGLIQIASRWQTHATIWMQLLNLIIWLSEGSGLRLNSTIKCSLVALIANPDTYPIRRAIDR